MKKEKEDIYSHILKYTGIFGGVQGLNILIGIVRNKFTALLLGPGGMGLASLFNSTINMVASASNFGLPTSGVQEISQKYEDCPDKVAESIKLIRSLTLVTAVLGFLICAIFAPLLNKLTFTWGDHTLHFVLLSPVVAFSIIGGGELAVLKATRQLKALAFTSVLVIFSSLLFTVPIYYFWGAKGIISVLFLQAFAQMACAIYFSVRHYPYSVSLSANCLRGGLHVVKLGLSFVVAGLFTSGAEFVIRTYLNNVSDLDQVGFFNAGWTLSVVYGGLVFTAMEADYFPRLSSIKQKGPEQNDCVSKQMEINVLLVGPILTAMIFLLPVLLPMLYSSSFSVILRMAQFATVGIIMRAIYLPIEYLPLSKGQSRIFLFQEAFCVVLLVSMEVLGYSKLGLDGLGLGIFAAYTIETISVICFSRYYYSYKMSRNAIVFCLVQLSFVLGALVLSFLPLSSCAYWLVAVLLCLLHVGCTFFLLKRYTKVFDMVMAKIHR